MRCSSPAARRRLAYAAAHKYRVLPLSVVQDGRGAALLTALCAAPLGEAERRELRFAAGCEVAGEPAHGSSVERAIHAAYLSDELEAERAEALPAAAFLERLLKQAVVLGASDIHIEPGATGCEVRFRVDGQLRPAGPAPGGAAGLAQLARRVRVLAKLPPSDSGEALEGAFSAEVGLQRLFVRASSVGCSGGEKIALRVLGNDAYALDCCGDWQQAAALLAQFGMTAAQIKLLAAAMSRQSGCIVVGGPTGSGKSTLLHLLICVLAGQGAHVVTVEDPVERRIAGVAQITLARGRGQTYAETLPFLLRQDPDVIMIGEIRDRVSAETALNAALTGHLVLTTVHASSAIEVVDRFRQLGISDELLSASLQLVAAQRLVARNCGACSTAAPAADFIAAALQLPPGTRVYFGAGCEVCGGSGQLGRVGAYELLPFCGAFREAAIARAAPQDKQRLYREISNRSGLPSLAQRMRMHVIEGTVSPTAALDALGLGRSAYRSY